LTQRQWPQVPFTNAEGKEKDNRREGDGEEEKEGGRERPYSNVTMDPS